MPTTAEEFARIAEDRVGRAGETIINPNSSSKLAVDTRVRNHISWSLARGMPLTSRLPLKKCFPRQLHR